MAKPSDTLTRNLVLSEIRVAVSNYFVPARVLTRLIRNGVRVLTGRPTPTRHDGDATHGWWRSA